MKRISLLTLSLLLMTAAFADSVISNGVLRYDTDGNVINAHGACIIKDGARYYWFGEMKSDTTNAFQGFSCYSSDNLTDWKFERVVLGCQQSGLLGPNRVGERVKVMRCPSTGEYIMLMHCDDMGYSDQHIGIAVSNTVNGEYKFLGPLLYHGNPIRKWDMGVFQDEDGTGYLLIHHGPVYRLSDDYRSADSLVCKVQGLGEAPAMMKKDGRYYIFSSGLTGWERNDNIYHSAPSIAGPWTKHGLFCPKGTLTWNSQSTYVLPIQQGGITTYMFMGDRWSSPHQGSSATYMWLPLRFDGDSVSIPEYWQSWDVNTVKPVDVLEDMRPVMGTTGEWAADKPGTVLRIPFRGCQVAITGWADHFGGYGRVRLLDKDGKLKHSWLVDWYSKVDDHGLRFISPIFETAEYMIEIEPNGDTFYWKEKGGKIWTADGTFVKVDGIYSREYLVTTSLADEKPVGGSFKPTWESLEGQYQVPEWFRDAKLGIWAHWGPQCVEGSGDWMARLMYQEESKAWKWHREHYGHQSETGFKDILPLFKAEHWDPDSLVSYFKSLGAKYFVALGNHHDNYDLWDSKYQPWNSMRIGPHRDLLDGWAKAAHKHHLKFGVSLHADHAWTWYETTRRYDLSGKKMGVGYDGSMTKSDGKGKWWEGLDPQDLYQQQHPLSRGSWSNNVMNDIWGWGNGAAVPSREFVSNFYNRTMDVIHRYDPDLLYFDTYVAPFWPVSDCGLQIAANYYNHSLAHHKGMADVVMNTKNLDESQRRGITWDVERGVPNNIVAQPWQTCTCIGNWHYDTSYYEQDKYKSAATVVKMLVDIVSKNGNLLLSIPMKADGTMDDKEQKIAEQFRQWISRNGECLYGTRPWTIFGEGPAAEHAIRQDKRVSEKEYANTMVGDIRFTQTRKALYAIAMEWPEDGILRIKSLGKGSSLWKKDISSVMLLGYGKLKASQTSDGLVVKLPEKQAGDLTPVIRIKK